MHRYILAFCIFSFSGHPLWAQQENSLLWEITGNGLQHPSYLFGSFHVSDDRVFNLPDSVLPKMIRCEAVYCELNLDSAMDVAIKQSAQKAKKKVSEILTREEMDRLSNKLKKEKIHVQDDLENASPYQVYSHYEYEKFRKNDHTTFLDAFLFGVAKKYGKEVGGLEQPEEQFAALNDLSDKTQRELLLSIADSSYDQEALFEKMVQDYLDQNLTAIKADLYTNYSKAFTDILLTRRNYKMTDRMDSLMRLQSMFVIVGTGHLPGDEGIINLLIKKGYSVKAVISARTGSYKSLLPNETTVTWIDVTDSLTGYRIQMPSKPTALDLFSMDMKVCYDYSTGYVFMSAGIPMSTTANEGTFKEVVKNLESHGQVDDKKKITYRDATGYEYYIKNAQGNYVLRMITRDDMGYMLIVGLTTKKPDDDISAKFFNSLLFSEAVKMPNKVFVDDTAGFKMLVPAAFKLTEAENGDGYRQHVYGGLDYNSRLSYDISYADYDPGNFFSNTSRLFDKALSPLLTTSDYQMDLNKDSVYQSFPCRYLEVTYPDGSRLLARYILRDNRFFAIAISGKNTAGLEEARENLNSFTFLPCLPYHFTSYTPADSSFTVALPAVPGITTDSSTGQGYVYSRQYGASDRLSGNSCLIDEGYFSKYTCFENDSALFDHIQSLYVRDYDSIIIKTTGSDGKLTTRYLQLKSDSNEYLRRNVKMYLNGQKVYVLVFSANPNAHNDSMLSSFINSFKILKEDVSFNVFDSKLKMLLDDLHAEDSTIREEARSYLPDYKCEEKDIPLLESTLQRSFPDDTSSMTESRHAVYEKLFATIDSTKMIPYLKSNFYSIPEKGPSRLVPLEALADRRTEESILMMKDYLLHGRPLVSSNYWITGAFGNLMYDTVKEASLLYPEILELLNDSMYASGISRLTSHLIDCGLIDVAICEPYADVIYHCAETEYSRMEKAAKNQEDYYYSTLIYSAIDILTRLKSSDQVIQLMNRIVSDTLLYYKSKPIAYLINNGKTVDRKIIKDYVNADKTNRIFVYNELKKINRTDVYPKELKNQKFFAEADLLNVLSYDDDPPGKIELVEQRRTLYGGTMQRFYIFKLSWSEDEYYFGVAGPYPDDDQFYFEGMLTQSGYNLKSMSADEQFTNLIQQQ